MGKLMPSNGRLTLMMIILLYNVCYVPIYQPTRFFTTDIIPAKRYSRYNTRHRFCKSLIYNNRFTLKHATYRVPIWYFILQTNKSFARSKPYLRYSVIRYGYLISRAQYRLGSAWQMVDCDVIASELIVEIFKLDTRYYYHVIFCGLYTKTDL